MSGLAADTSQVWDIHLDQHSQWKAELVHRLNNIDAFRQEGGNYSAAITCILPVPQTQVVYTGDEDGRVVSFIPLALVSNTNAVDSTSGTASNGAEEFSGGEA